MLIVVIGVLSLILAFPRPPYLWVRDPSWVMLCAAVATLLPPALAMIFARRAVTALDRTPHDPSLGQYRYGQGMMIAQWSLGAMHGALVTTTDWLGMCYNAPWIPNWPMVAGLLAGVPLLLSVVLTWVAIYPADRAIREIALEVYLFRGKPAQPVWSLGRFITFNLRHQVLIIMVPMMMILAARDTIQMFDAQIRRTFGHDFAPDLLLGCAALSVALIAPLLLRHIWVTVPLPDGPLRDQLAVMCRKLKMRCREILVWKSGGMIINAAVMGVIAPVRYVMITDAMLEQMDDRKIEAVFGHEAGHVKRHHILFFLLFAFISGCALTVIGQRLRGHDRATFQVVTAIAGVVLMVKWGVVFGWISRNFERQADVFGVRTLMMSGLPCNTPCVVHGESTAIRGDPLCASAAHLFSETLNDVAHLNNIPTEAWSWRHGSIASRSRVLQRYAQDPIATAGFERGILRMKAGILIVAVVSCTWAICELQLWTVLGL
jgi:STE24 endopeptidase